MDICPEGHRRQGQRDRLPDRRPAISTSFERDGAHFEMTVGFYPDDGRVGEVFVNADDGLLRQLVTNLLDNAVQYTPPGGLVTVAVQSDAASATIRVSDTGPGIALADRERVFERFVRLDPARSATSGAGLGLPIARWITEQHEGTLTVEQNKVGGCTFVVRLPIKHLPSLDARTADSPVHTT